MEDALCKRAKAAATHGEERRVRKECCVTSCIAATAIKQPEAYVYHVEMMIDKLPVWHQGLCHERWRFRIARSVSTFCR